MKKALSVLLTLALAVGLAVCAFAAKESVKEPRQSPPSYQKMEARRSPAADLRLSPSLNYELPTVTGIEAVWDGETEGLFHFVRGPLFNPENVTVTVIFEGGETEDLTSWWGKGEGSSSFWWWELWYDYDEKTGNVTFYYNDSNLWVAYLDTITDADGNWEWNEQVWEVYLATLPRASFSIPVSLREEHLNSLPKTELKLAETKKAVLAEGEEKLFAFTPEKTGLYYFYSKNQGKTDPYAELYTADFNFITYNDDFFDLNFGIVMELSAGHTFYLAVSDYWWDAGEFDVCVSDKVRRLSAQEALIEYMTGGIFWNFYYDDGYGSTYAFPGEGSMLETLRSNLGVIWTNILWNLINYFFRFW